MKDVSVVICVRDCVQLARENLPLIRAALPDAELVIVDGKSKDGTWDVAKQYADILVSDEGRGLAAGRQFGVASATRSYVLMAGGDNRLTPSLVAAMRSELEKDPRLAGVSAQTNVIDANTYWEKATVRIFRHLINRAGYTNIIGTPYMYKRPVLLDVQFDSSIKACDDTDLCERLVVAGYKLKIIDEYAEEKWALDFAEFEYRWRGYGRSDAEFYHKYHRGWGLWRKFLSWTHPLRKYGLRGTWRFLIHGDLAYIPALWIALFARYRGWVKAARATYFGR